MKDDRRATFVKKSGRPTPITAFSVAIPWRPLIGRLGLLLLLTLSFFLLILSKTDHEFVRTIRVSATTVLVPVLDVMTRPMDAASDFGSWASSFVQMRSENLRLKAENAELLRWQLVARQMDAENRSLRTLMQFSDAHGLTYSTARIVTDAAGPFARTALLDAGSGAAIAKHEAVVSERGLVGRVVEVGPNNSRVLLVTDINSRIPVIGEISREKSVLAGNNSDLPVLNYLPDDTKIAIGERVVTAGDGKLLPAGIPVGVVKRMGATIQVQPLVDWSRLELVSVAHLPQD